MGLISGLASIIFINSPVVGASGAIWGIMMLFALFNPNELLVKILAILRNKKTIKV